MIRIILALILAIVLGILVRGFIQRQSAEMRQMVNQKPPSAPQYGQP